MLRGTWRITCPESCACHDEDYVKLQIREEELVNEILSLGQNGRVEAGLKAVRELEKIRGQMSPIANGICGTFYDGYQIAIAKKSKLKEATQFIQQAHKSAVELLGTHSALAQKYETFVRDPKSHMNFGAVRN